MANKPYMPLMMGDWVKGTRGMRADVKGVYIGLLIHQYDTGYIPKDIEELSLIEPEVRKVWDKLKDKFEEFEPGRLRNKKCEEVRAFWSKQRSNGTKGGRPKAKQKPNNNPNPNPKPNHHIDLDIDNAFIVDKESAWKELSNDEMLMEDAKITATQKGWRAPKEIDILGCMYTFIAKIELPTERDDLRRYWRNWLFREQTEKLIEYGKNYRQQRQQAKIH